MLILTRRLGEKLMIGDDIMIIVLGIKGNQVRIGVEAPKEVEVHREEIYERIRSERLAVLQTKLTVIETLSDCVEALDFINAEIDALVEERKKSERDDGDGICV